MELQVVDEVLTVVNELIDGRTLTIDDLDEDLMKIGIDSIKFIQLVVALEEKMECEIPDSKLFLAKLNTVNKLLEVMSALPDEKG